MAPRSASRSHASPRRSKRDERRLRGSQRVAQQTVLLALLAPLERPVDLGADVGAEVLQDLHRIADHRIRAHASGTSHSLKPPAEFAHPMVEIDLGGRKIRPS